MSIAENKQIIQAFYDAANRGDTMGFMRYLADEVTWHNLGSTRFSGTFAGKQTLVDRLLTPLFEQLKRGISCTIDNIIAEGDFVVVQLRGRAETKDGRAYDNTYCHIFQLRDGIIVGVNEYMDTELVTAVFGK